MFQRSFLRQSRTVQSHIQSRSISSSLSTSRTVPSPFLSQSRIAPVSRLSRRCVTTDAEEKSLGHDDGNPSEPAAQEEANPLQKELDAKSKEAIEFKVRTSSCYFAAVTGRRWGLVAYLPPFVLLASSAFTDAQRVLFSFRHRTWDSSLTLISS